MGIVDMKKDATTDVFFKVRLHEWWSLKVVSPILGTQSFSVLELEFH